MRPSSFIGWSASFAVLALLICTIALAVPSGTDQYFSDLLGALESSHEAPTTVSLSSSTVGSYDGMANPAKLNQEYRDHFSTQITEQLYKTPPTANSRAPISLIDNTRNSSEATSYLGVAIVQAATEPRAVYFGNENGDAESDTPQIDPVFLVLIGFGVAGLMLWAWNRRSDRTY